MSNRLVIAKEVVALELREIELKRMMHEMREEQAKEESEGISNQYIAGNELREFPTFSQILRGEHKTWTPNF